MWGYYDQFQIKMLANSYQYKFVIINVIDLVYVIGELEHDNYACKPSNNVSTSF